MRLREMARERGVWILTAAVAALFWRPLTFETFFFRDLYLLFYPKKLFLAEALHSGTLPLWDRFTNGGQPYLANPANTTFHPTNVLYLLLPTIDAFNWILVLHVLFCMLAAYWLARTVRLPQEGAFVTGAIFGLCGFTLSAANLTPLLLALPWIPVTIGLTHRALRDRRSIIPAAVAAAIPLYSGAAEVTAILFVTLVVWVATARCEDVRPGAKAGAVAIVIVFAIALSALQVLPATSVVEQSSRSHRRTYAGFTKWSVAPQRLPELVVPRFLGPVGTLDDREYWGKGLESDGFPYILSLYFGFPALFLAAWGAARRADDEIPRRALATLVIIAILLSLGRSLPGFRLFYELPLVTTFRYPVKALIAAIFPIALLAGSGVSAMGRRSRTALGVALVTGGAAVMMFSSAGFARAFARLFSFDAPSRALLAGSLGHAALAALALAIAVRLPRRREAFIAGVVLLDLAVAGVNVNAYAPRALFDEPPFARGIRRLVDSGRFYAAERETNLRAPTDEIFWLARWQISALAGYTAAQFRIPVVYHADYDGLAPTRTAALSSVMGRLRWERRRPLLDLADVRIFSTTDVISLPGVRELVSFAAPGRAIRFYENRGAASARFVSSVRAVGSEAEAASALLRSADRAQTIVERLAVPTMNCGAAPVALLRRGPSSDSYRVNAPCAGYVVFAENYYDGWRATIDGRPAAIVRADFAFSAVAVGEGRHTIERTYTQPRLIAGLVTTIVAALLLAIVGPLWRRSQAKERPADPHRSSDAPAE